MKPYRISAVVLRHAYEVRRNANHITYMVYWPVVNIAVWGFFTLYLRHGDRLRPGVISCLLGAVILWGLFNAFQRDMAVGFLEELWSRNLVSLFASPLTISEYVTGLIIVTVAKAMVGLIVESLIAWLFYHYNIFPMLPKLIPFILNLVLFALIDRHCGDRPDLPLHHEVPSDGVELRRHTDAAFLCLLSLEFVTELPASDGLNPPNYPRFRRYARSYRKRQVLGSAFQIRVRIERDLLPPRHYFLPMDVRSRAIAWAVSENGINKLP